MFERFTDRARRVVVLAQEEARRLGHEYTGTEHILLGLVNEGEGVAARALVGLGVDLDAARQAVEHRIGRTEATPRGQIPFTPRAKRVLELSLRSALELGHNYIGTEHLLLGLVREGEGVAAEVLTGLGVELQNVHSTVVELLSGHTPQSPEPVLEPAGAGPPPRCPNCGASFAEGLAVTSVVARHGVEASERRLLVAYCSDCGRSAGVFPE